MIERDLEVELDGATYRVGRLNAFQQWHVFRRIVPLFGAFEGFSEKQDEARASLLAHLMPLFEAARGMSDEDTNYVLNTCLSAVTVRDKVTKGWSRLSQGGGLLMFEISMTVMLRLTMYVIMENLSDFFTRAASGDLPAAAESQAANQS